MNQQADRKTGIQFIVFLIIMILTLYAVTSGQDLGQVMHALSQMSPLYLGTAVATALFFVSAEGCMIWYLMISLDGRSSLPRCIAYSFIGFFYSWITPSATGGQPMQLYHMQKDGNKLADSSVVLMTVALVYKFVLVIIGIGILIFWNGPLRSYLDSYYPLYLLGLSLNTGLVVILAAVMLAPGAMQGIVIGVERLLVRVKILKHSEERERKIAGFVQGYREAVVFLTTHRRKVAAVVLFTFVQRASVFLLTWIVYRSFPLEGTDMLTVVFLQASVYIAVDMLPIPGAQGITELMYQGVFKHVFTDGFLMPSLYVTRGINFYLMLLISLLVVIGNAVRERVKRE